MSEEPVLEHPEEDNLDCLFFFDSHGRELSLAHLLPFLSSVSPEDPTGNHASTATPAIVNDVVSAGLRKGGKDEPRTLLPSSSLLAVAAASKTRRRPPRGTTECGVAAAAMISSSALSVPRGACGSTHSINTVGLGGAGGGGGAGAGGGGRHSGSYDWSNYAYPPTSNVYAYGRESAAEDEATAPPEPYNLEELLLLRYSEQRAATFQ